MKNITTIVFFLPEVSTKPIGGYKVVYEYANFLAKDGYNVVVFYEGYPGSKTKFNFIINLARILICRLIFIFRKNIHQQWFVLDSRIQEKTCWKIKDAKFWENTGLKIVATALRTSFELNELKKKRNFDGYYLIQGFEAWGAWTKEDVFKSYAFPFRKIAISPWLYEIVKEVSDNVDLIENGLDFNYFKLTTPIENRNPYKVAMLYHIQEVKRTCDAFSALEIVHEKYPMLHVNIFGVFDKPKNLPSYHTYYKSPDKAIHNMIYNTAAIFVAPSRLEGMGLTPAEAMICGCALACTDNPGFSIFAKDNETCLVSPVCNPEKLADNIIRLIKDDDERIRLAKNGNAFIKKFTWQKSYEKIKAALGLTNFGL